MINIPIGQIELKHEYEFTQYGEHAAWTDYVTCPRQVVQLRYVDDYWVCASFIGTLTRTTYPPGAREVGTVAKAGCQTQAFGGIGDWLDSEMFQCKITHPDYHVEQVSTYQNGLPMFALLKRR